MAYTIDNDTVTAAGTYFANRLGNTVWSAQSASVKLAALQDAATDLGTLLPGGFPAEPEGAHLAALYEQALFLCRADDPDTAQILSESIDGAGSRTFAKQSSEERGFSSRALRLLASSRGCNTLSRG